MLDSRKFINLIENKMTNWIHGIIIIIIIALYVVKLFVVDLYFSNNNSFKFDCNRWWSRIQTNWNRIKPVPVGILKMLMIKEKRANEIFYLVLFFPSESGPV